MYPKKSSPPKAESASSQSSARRAVSRDAHGTRPWKAFGSETAPASNSVSAQDTSSEAAAKRETQRPKGAPSSGLNTRQQSVIEKLSKYMNAFSRLYNGYEVHGIERIPLSGPALIVFYHGPLPIDSWYFSFELYRKTGRWIRGLGDSWLISTPFFKELSENLRVMSANAENAKKLLADGHIVGIVPGNIRLFDGGESASYKPQWKDLDGFAKIAQEMKVDIIPVFTENIEQTYLNPRNEAGVLKQWSKRLGIKATPVIGMGLLPFPVKLRSRVGEPVRYSPDLRADELFKRTQSSLEALIKRYQDPHKSVVTALRKRFIAQEN
ncbi:MAG: hypothetical protein COT74_06230 [Bdellovibrionales bacterium CG10_big_fil_rev_8_21_14_0_10_45_34]|nr:MAG: hypothetical protein COT74_06230 [Bdellovibrionales bacterium CG10_big_fil_rev_8_21_14_0_10_45_34]